MSERFYTNCDLQPGPVVLQGPEAHHLAKVSRLRAGDAICLFNGNGHEYPARVETIEKKSVLLEVFEEQSPERELLISIELACPLPKGDRAQFLIEKLTELGVNAYIPLATDRSVVLPRESKLEKLERYVIEACKQCGRNKLMAVKKQKCWPEYCKAMSSDRIKLIAHPGATNSSLEHAIIDANSKLEDVVLAIGPEGGFTDAEISLAMESGWHPLGLGNRILRIETAALVVVAWVIQHGAESTV